MGAIVKPDQLCAWKPVVPPPPGYEQVIRRTFETGLHVLVLALQRGEEYDILSAFDHGTPRMSVKVEGKSSSVSGTVDIVCETCGRRNEITAANCPATPALTNGYLYVDDSGEISPPVTREALFDLVRSGVITWESQVWESSRSLTGLGQWQPNLWALGFPTQHQMDAFM